MNFVMVSPPVNFVVTWLELNSATAGLPGEYLFLHASAPHTDKRRTCRKLYKYQ